MAELEAIEAEDVDRDWDLLENIEEPEPDYANSGALDLHLYSKAPEVEAAAKHLCSEIGYALDRAITHMKVVLLNLYWSNHMCKERWLGYSRNNNRYGTIPFRYNRQRIEVHPLIKVIDGLHLLEYIDHADGKFVGVAGKGRCSRMRATQKLIDLLIEEYGLTIDMVGRHPEEEVIYLKGIKAEGKKLIYYEDTDETEEMRRFLNQYNEFIQKTYIDIDYMGYEHKRMLRRNSADYLLKLPTGLNFDLSKRKMRRIFNNGSFTQGGRFYGGFWMEMPSKLRLRLIIELQKVVEIDFGGIHIHLLYNAEGVDYGATGQDPYRIPGYGTTTKDRNLFKKLLLATVNAQADGRSKGETKAAMALQKDINFNPTAYPSDIPDIKKVISDFREHHAPISKYLCTGAGYHLMYQDSCIAEHVLKEMFEQRIPVLPVHDSFICPKQYADTLIDAMTAGYRHVTGATLTRSNYTANIKDADEWDRSTAENPDGDYYFDPTYTEDEDLIRHMMAVDNALDGFETEQCLEPSGIVRPHRLYVRIPITYESAQQDPPD